MEKKFAERALKKLGFTLDAVQGDGKTSLFSGSATSTELGFVQAEGYSSKSALYDRLVHRAQHAVDIAKVNAERVEEPGIVVGYDFTKDRADPVAFDGTREQWLLAFTELARSKFEEVNAPIPAIVRVSVGFPSKGVRSNVIGECWSSSGNAEGICEIFIRPSVQSNSLHLAGILTHELMHAAVGHEAGHGKKFSKPLKALGMVGKATHMVDGPEWRAWAQPLVDQLGAFPGSDLKGTLAGGKKKQGTRMLKLSCDECDFTCRSTQKHIDKIGEMRCVDPDCEGTLSTEEKEG